MFLKIIEFYYGQIAEGKNSSLCNQIQRRLR